MLFAAAQTSDEAPREYELKAACLYKFADFVEWPAKAFADDQAPLLIGVLGEDPFGAILDSTVKAKKVKNRGIVVKRAAVPQDLAQCHVVFVSSSEKERFKEVLSSFEGLPVLTVGEERSFADARGIVSLFIAEKKIAFEINTGTAEKAGLKINSQLLKLAKAVTP